MPESRRRALKRAILYLKYVEKIKADNDVAHETGISTGMLSGMLTGKKKISEEWLTTFENLYELKISDPFSYVDLEWLFPGIKQPVEKDGLNPKVYIELYQDMKGVLIAKEERIYALEARLQTVTNEKEAIKKELHIMQGIIQRYEQDILDAVMRTNPGDEDLLRKMLKQKK
jgi:transcriptional regulator with XRE-family HTH domain